VEQSGIVSDAEQYLKEGVRFSKLNKIANAKSDIEYTKYTQEEKYKRLRIVHANP